MSVFEEIGKDYRGNPIYRYVSQYSGGMLPESDYLKYLQGKRCIIVGPAGYLRGQRLGENIDKFDCVVRVNHALPILYPEDYGGRTNVLYHILSHRNYKVTKKRLVTEDEIQLWEKQIDWLVSRHAPRSTRVRQIRELMGDRLQWTCASYEHEFSVCRGVGRKSPNTGVFAIAHLLESDLKTLNVIGFDFYASGVYEGYGDVGKDEHADEVNKNWHDTDAQLEYLAILQRRDNRLFYDKRLHDLIGERSHLYRRVGRYK